MRTILIIGLLIGLLAGFLLSGQVATSQEEPFPAASSRGAGTVSDRRAFDVSPPIIGQRNGHLMDSDVRRRTARNGAGSGSRSKSVSLEPSPSPSTGRDIARMRVPPTIPAPGRGFKITTICLVIDR